MADVVFTELLEGISFEYFHKPYDYVLDVIGSEPTWQQAEVLLALQKGERFISVRSGHGIGKTAIQAWIVQWFLATHPNSRVPCTAPTSPQLKSVLWPEIKKWQNASKLKDVFEWTNTTFSVQGLNEVWFAVARTSNKPDNLQGFHEGHIMFVVEEASGVPEDIMQVVEGALTTEGAYCVMFGNPTQLSGLHYDSFHRDKHLWKTFTFNAEESPLVSRDSIERKRAKYGAGSDVYRVRVLGLHPRGASDAIFTYEEAYGAMHRELPPSSSKTAIIGNDVARFGDDQTVFLLRIGNTVTTLDKFYKEDTMFTADKAMFHIKKLLEEGYHVIYNVDDGGVGGGVTDRVRQLRDKSNLDFVMNAVNFGAKAMDDEHYANKGTELWMLLKDRIKDLKIPDDEELLHELCDRRKKQDAHERIILEKKADMKKRNPGHGSPDTADALVLTMEEDTAFVFLEDKDSVIF